MSGVDVGGDSSVEWRVFVENVRRSTITNCTIGDFGFEQAGVDETDPGDFTVTIKMPGDAKSFIESLARAAMQAKEYAGKTGAPITFVLPIEPKNPDQIQIRWKSSVPSVKEITAATRGMKRAMPVPKGSMQKKTVKNAKGRRR